MFVDNNLVVSGGVSSTGSLTFQTVTGSAAATVLSTNCVDLVQAREIGTGQPLFARLLVGTTFAGSSSTTAGPTSISVEVISSDDSAQSVNVFALDKLDIPCNPTSSAATLTAANGVATLVTWNNHGLTANTPVVITAGTLTSTGLSASTIYYVVGSSITANTFTVSATVNGAAITGTGSATPTITIFGSVMIAGNRYAVQINPRIGSKGQEFLGLRYTINGATGSAGTLFADFGMEIQDLQPGVKAYPAGFSIK